MIREDRELVAQRARLGREMVPLAMRIMEGSARTSEPQDYAQRLIAAGERLRQRAGEPVRVVIDGEVLKGSGIASDGRKTAGRLISGGLEWSFSSAV